MPITSWPLVNRLSGTGSVVTIGTFPVAIGTITLPPYGALPVVNQYGVSLGTSGGGGPYTLGFST